MDLEIPSPESIIHEDDQLYVCLAHHPITKGHSIVVWKDHVEDIHQLKRNEYLHLMRVVDSVRDALLKTYSLEKVYLIYADEIKHVHWHLVPRYVEKGLNILSHDPVEILDFSDAKLIAKHLKL